MADFANSATQNQDTSKLMEQILYEVKRIVVGQDKFLERVMVAILAQGHLLGGRCARIGKNTDY
jgi:MoxR-like ATPase